MAKKLRVTKALREYWRANGAKGGKIGGKRRAELLSPERRREIGKLAAAARWKTQAI